MRMLESLKTIKEKVEIILLNYEITRDSDKYLWLAYLVEFHNLRNEIGDSAYLKMKKIVLDDKTPTMESIRRIRQKFQESGDYVGKNRASRMNEADEVRDWIAK